MGKAGAFGHGAMALKHFHIMATSGQFVGGGDADDAGANDGNFHGGRRVLWA